jgi:type IV secretory pathway VirB9-like protein
MNKYLISAAILLNLNTTANAAKVKDLLVNEAPDQIEEPSAMSITTDQIYNYDMGETAEVFDEEYFDPAETVLNKIWIKDETIQVRLRLNMETVISIPSEDRISGIILGDPFGFKLTTMSDNVVSITPTAHDIETNLVILGEDKKLYTFHLRSGKKVADNVPHFAVNIETPKNPIASSEVDEISTEIQNWDDNSAIKKTSELKGKALRIEQERLKKESLIRKLTDKDYDFLTTLEASKVVNPEYRIFGNKAIAPNAVWDDGRYTYISFRDGTPSQRLPVLYRTVNGYAVIANSHYRDGFIIADAVTDEGWMLIDGENIICIEAPKYTPKEKHSLEQLDNLVNEEN